MPPFLSLTPRQSGNSDSFAPVPSSYGSANSSPHPGVVAGIVIGSVGGFLLLLFLIYSCLGFGPSLWVQPSRSEYTAASQSVLSFRTRRSAAPSRARSQARRASRGGARVTETYEVRTRESRGGRRAPPVVLAEPVIVEPTRQPPPPRVVRSDDSEDDDEDEDEIVVLEEHSPPRRKSRRRSESRRSEERYSRVGSHYHDAEPGSPYRERRDRRYSRDR